MLITLEGLDGSGKTSAWSRLQESEAVPADATFTCEPTETWYGEAVDRSVADSEADSLAELFLYTADHAAHLDATIRPALSEDRVVVSDRYSDSRYAYQGATLATHPHFDVADPLAFVREVHDPWTRPPDATLFFDVDPATGAERSGATNKLEQVDFLETVRDNYERLLTDDPDRFIRIDANRPAEAVMADVETTVADLLEA